MSKKVIQVPVDQDLLEALDVISKRIHRSRSEVIRQACQSYVRHAERESLDEAYIEGYRRQPEEPAIALTQVGMLDLVLPDESW